MAGFYSNHSQQSRFLVNSSAAAQTQAHTTTTTTTTTTAQSSAANSTKTAPYPRPRVPPSKHFSTSVSTSSSGDEKPQGKDKKDKVGLGGVHGHPGATSNGLTKSITSVHPLRNTWVFWFRQHRAPGNRITDYEEGIKQIGKFSSVESFWLLWTHLTPPSALLPTTDYLLFHSGIRRPVWEDPLNAGGGKWIIRLKKGVADRLWEEIVMAVVGDQFEDDTSGGEVGENGSGGGEAPELCGCTLSVRQSEDVLSIWNRRGEDGKVTAKIRETIRRVLNLPPTTKMEYKTNNDSIHDKPNIRPIPERPASEKAALS